MNRYVGMFVLGGLMCGTFAWADMVETKKDGILNGKIVSEDAAEVHFKDAKGKERVFKKKDILFMDKETPAKAAKRTSQKILETLKKIPENIKKSCDALTEKFIGTVGKPLDRSAADAKSKALADSLEQAGKASAAGVAKTSAFNKEVYRQQSEARDAASSSSGGKKGHFSSLDS